MKILKVAMGCLFLGLVFSPVYADDTALFDKPLQVISTPLPPDTLNPDARPKLSCFYYPRFMVKQVDLGEDGAEQLSIIDLPDDHKEPPCRRKNARNERVIDSRAWSGYFKGVKGEYVFFDGTDGPGFAVFYTGNANKIFSDSATDIHAIDTISPGGRNSLGMWHDSSILLRYGRIYVAPCSLRSNEKSCWETIKQTTGLTDAAPPDCSAAYKTEEDRAPDRRQETSTDPTVITYEVEVVLGSDNATRITPVSGATSCYPAE